MKEKSYGYSNPQRMRAMYRLKGLHTAISWKMRYQSVINVVYYQTMCEVNGNEKKPTKDKTLIFCQSGITAIVRKLSQDILKLLPHCRSEAKYGKEPLSEISEVLNLRNANRCVFFQVKKHRDPYMWISNHPNGPSVKFLLENIETLDRNFNGNCRVGTRAILSFSKEFDSQGPHLKIIKEMLTSIFRTPSKKNTPVDHIFCFYYLDHKIWFRNYQIVDYDSNTLQEIGPRFSLNAVCMLEATFRGQTIYKNSNYISPSKNLSATVKKAAIKNKRRIEKKIFKANEAQDQFRYHDDINDVFKSD